MPDETRRRLRPLDGLPPDTLLVSELFQSIQGESSFAGRPCTFVRTTGCNLRCAWCDTTYAFEAGERMTVPEILAKVAQLGWPLVEVTGGEPLVQPAAPELLRRLCDAGYTVLLETNGSIDIQAVDPRVVRVMDLKTPSSGEARANRDANLESLRPHDELKIVIGDRGDYEWARDQVRRRRLDACCTVLMSSVKGALAPEDLASWILEDHLPVRLQVQLHKILWGSERRGV